MSSLFPAYGEKQPQEAPIQEQSSTPPSTSSATQWQTNASFDNANLELVPLSQLPSSSSNSSCSDSEAEPEPDPSQIETLPQIEFDGRDEFYVDKQGRPLQSKWKTLPRLSRPVYKVNCQGLKAKGETGFHSVSWRRISRQRRELTLSHKMEKPSEQETNKMLERIQQLKGLVKTEPQKLNLWLELYELIEQNVEKANRLAQTEQQLRYLKMALEHHKTNELLFQLYMTTANKAYAASEVATMIEQLLERNPFEYTLWCGLIMTTQGTMSRCNVPDVLKIYAQSMRRMHLGYSEESNPRIQPDTDGIMLKLFHNCVLFLRQSSNTNQMFALLKLALELNVPGLTFDCFEAQAKDEQQLIEYEEMVLHSGMPMTEIWTRVERLRQAFNFLPYPQLRHTEEEAVAGGLDPQRCVFNDDVCQYIYPLKHSQNRLNLLLLAVQLTKMPFIRTNSLAERLCARIEQIGDSDAIEMLMAELGDRSTYALTGQSEDFASALLDLSKEMYVSPTFLPQSLGHELYVECISSLLLKCSLAFPHSEAQRRVFIILWFRFKRLNLRLVKLYQKPTDAFVRQARLQMRELLSQAENRRLIRLYLELGMFEYELLERDDIPEPAFRIFKNLITSQDQPEHYLFNDPDLHQAYVIYAEMLFARNQREQSLHMLICLCLERHATMTTHKSSLLSDQALHQSSVAVERELALLKTLSPEMNLEEYFNPQKFLILLKARCLLLTLTGHRDQSLNFLQSTYDSLLDLTPGSRSLFIREQVREMQVLIYQIPLPALGSTVVPLVTILELSLDEFPRNQFLLRHWIGLPTVPWYKLRSRLIRTQAGILSLLYLILAARCRFSLSALQEPHLQSVIRPRVLSMFETFLPTNPNRSDVEAAQYEILRRNSLYWRCYLRCLSDRSTGFEVSKKCLLTALDECPWDKALYMDGAIYVPQELDHLQDLMIEKELRMFAMPEELDILREN